MHTTPFDTSLGTVCVSSLPALADNYIYTIERDQELLVVDPGTAPPVLHHIRTRPLRAMDLLLTHHHADHTGGMPALRRHRLLRHVYAPADPRIGEGVTHPVAHDDALSWNGLRIRIMATPGHTRSHLAYHLPDLPAVFSGDALFLAGCGRLFEGDGHDLHTTTRRFLALPEETRLFCAHEYALDNLAFAAHVEPGNPAIQRLAREIQAKRAADRPSVPSTMGQEKGINPFLRADQPAIIRHLGLSCASPASILGALRHAKDAW